MSIVVERFTRSAEQIARAQPREADALWRSLFYFNVYRLAGAAVLFTMAAIWSTSLPFGSRDYGLFVSLTAIYCVFSLICFALIRTRWHFDLQLNLQVAADV